MPYTSHPDNRIHVLHIVGAMYPGGMENFIMNIYEHIDRNRFCFDFAVHDIKENGYENRIRELGGKVVQLPRMTRHPIRNLRLLTDHIKQEHYDIVIRHTANASVAPQLLVAKRQHVTTVCHSHNETDPKKILHYLSRLLLIPSADVRLACSENAGKWMYGHAKYQVVHNAIDLDRFAYSPEKRRRITEEFHLQGKHVYGHIANFIASKNHTFLLDVFHEITRSDPDAVLICLGTGELRQSIEDQARSTGIADKVFFTGTRHDADAFLSAFELMIFPSLFEGLPLTLIEAQVSGIPVLMSDRITPEVAVTDGLLHPRSLSDPPQAWAEEAIRLREESAKKERVCQRERIRAHGYDLEQLVAWYEEFLTNLVGHTGGATGSGNAVQKS